jgi:hypothetical protein
MAQPQIIMENPQGRHNSDLGAARARLVRGRTYQDLSTVCVVPTRGVISARVVQNWMGMMTPMNQKFMRLFISGMEVGEAYNQAIEIILNNPDLSTWKYILTLEEDNLPPPDGLIRLYEGMEQFDVVGGLYWTKGEEGQPMIYGDPAVMPKSFAPQMPQHEALQEANGLGMGFNLFKIEMFKKLPKPWFKTMQEYIPGQGMKLMTQDLYFYEQAAMHGFRFACDTRVKVGHYDNVNDLVW